MSVSQIHTIEWAMPGCDERCSRGRHHPVAHEDYGRFQERRQAVVRTGPLVVDLDQRTVTVDGVEVRLTTHEWKILSYLAERFDAWCSTHEMIRAIWGRDALVTVEGHSLIVHRYRLRKKLRGAGDLIVCTRGSYARTRLVAMEPTR